MSNIAIKVENLGKLYRLGEVGTGTISHDLNRWWAKIRGKQDPFALIGESNDRTSKGNSNYVWALQDVGFEVKQGEVLGIIGRNGAGKSTLLKLLSKVTQPTTGRIKLKGRIASLLEVGTGFHPEMTGRENVFQNGAILGMTRAEIRAKFDEIVDFAGVERYIDTPVKRYSSGMYVRLAFAVAAHLEQEILVVDEVLAVGDAEFQKKCLGKMKDVSVNGGRTVLFVSHNMASVKQLCNRGIVLKQGGVTYEGNALEAVNYYISEGETETRYEHHGSLETALGNGDIRILKMHAWPLQGELLTLSSGVGFELEFYNSKKDINLDVTFEIVNQEEVVVTHNGSILTTNNNSKQGIYKVKSFFPPNVLNAGKYRFKIIFGESQRYVLFQTNDIIEFEIENEIAGSNASILPGVMRLKMDFTVDFSEMAL